MAEEGLAPQTGKSYMAAVRNVQLSLGLPDPREKSSLPVLRRVQAGISRLRLSRDTPTRNRLPITAHLLRQLRSTWERTSHPNRVLLWAVSCTAFFGFFRLGELLRDSPRASTSHGGMLRRTAGQTQHHHREDRTGCLPSGCCPQLHCPARVSPRTILHNTRWPSIG